MTKEENFFRQVSTVGKEGQIRLQNSIVWLRGLRFNSSTHLAYAGIEHFIFVDCQYSELSNLKWQCILTGCTSKLSKVEHTSQWIRINPQAAVLTVNAKVEK